MSRKGHLGKISPELLQHMFGGKLAGDGGTYNNSDVQNDGIDHSKWHIIYPNYINSEKTIKMGRKIPANKAVKNPTCDEIKLICEHLNIPCHIERNKAYPRDWVIKGRIRYLFKNPDGTTINPEISTSYMFCLRIT